MFFLVTVISVTVSLPTLKKRSCAQDRQFCNLCTSHLDMCRRVGLDAVGNEWKEGHNADGGKSIELGLPETPCLVILYSRPLQT